MHTTWHILFQRFTGINLQTRYLQTRKSASDIVEPCVGPGREAQDEEVFAVGDACVAHCLQFDLYSQSAFVIEFRKGKKKEKKKETE